MKKLNYIILLALLVIQIGITSAVYCIPNIVNQNVTQGVTSTNTVQCFNLGENTVNLNKIGTGFTFDTNSIQPNSSKNITLTFDSTTSPGTYLNSISFDDNTNPLSVILTVNKQESSNGIIVFPTYKLISIETKTIKTLTLQLIVPSNYPNTITLQGLSFNPDISIATFGDLDLGSISPGQTVNIPIKIDSTNAQTGTYATEISLLATDKNGQITLPKSKLDITVQNGLSPVTNQTFTVRPICSLSSVVMNINNTYSLSCTNVVSNIDITPKDNEYFEGLSVDTVQGLFTYNFKPVKFGLTNFIVNFNYKNAPVFAPFNQEVRISASSFVTGGSKLDLLFTPSLSVAKPGQYVVIQLVDNRSLNLVDNPEIYVNAIPLNKNGSSFYMKFDANTNYSFRGVSPGYDNLVQDYWLESKPMILNITPASGDSGTLFFISTDINATIYIDERNVNVSYVGTIPQGNHTIKAVKDGYIDSVITMNIDASSQITFTTVWEKDVKQLGTLNKNVSWNLKFSADLIGEKQIILSGQNEKVEFTPKDKGVYTIEVDNKIIWSNEIKGWDGKVWKFMWYWWVVGLIVGMMLYFFVKSKRSSTAQFSGMTNLH